MQLDDVTQLVRTLGRAAQLKADGEMLDALAVVGRAGDMFGDLVTGLAIEAYQQGHTQKAIAAALGVPASTLRGIKAEAAATR
jgi:hypothetical protein